MLHQAGALTIDEAVDDQGHALATRASNLPETVLNFHSPSVVNSWSSLLVNVEFVAPIRAGSVINRLRGKVPVVVLSTRRNLLVIPLRAGTPAQGRPFPNRAQTIVADGPSPAAGQKVSVKVTVYDMNHETPFDQRRPDPTRVHRDRIIEHIELHDATGRRLNHTKEVENTSDDRHSYELTVQPFGQNAPLDAELARAPNSSPTRIPAALIYYELEQTPVTISFDLRDVIVP